MKRSGVAETTVQMPQLLLRAEVRSDGINVAARTADLIFSTGAPVHRYDWMSGESYFETLSLEPGAVRLDRLNMGGQFLNAHRASDIADVLGVIVEGSARIADGQAVATVRFSKRPTVEPFWQDVKDRILRNVSVGYVVHRYEVTQATKDSPQIRHAVDWEPYEISSVPIPADAGAQVRDAKTPTYPCVIVRAAAPAGAQKEPSMPDETTATVPVEDKDNRANAPSDAEVARTSERERVNGILRGCTAINLSMDYAQRLIDSGMSLVKAQAQILEEARKVGHDAEGPRQGPSGVTIARDELDTVRKGMTNALLHRIEPGWFPLEEEARPYRSKSMLRIAEECLEANGIRTRELDRMQIAGMALGLQVRAGLHTTSDFANILADVANKTLRRAYEVAPQTWQPFSRRISMPDFKPVRRNQLGEAPALLKVLEHGEFTSGTVAEGKEQFQLSTYGRIFGITRQALVNDDLDAFSRLVMSFGRSARNLESDVIYYQLLKNAAMGDGILLFNAATHQNYTTGPGTAIDVASLGVGAAAMMKQRALDGVTYLNLTPRYLVTTPTKMTIAMQYTTVINPNIGSSVNPWQGMLTPIAEPRLEGGVTVDGDTVAGSTTAWYLAASTDQIDVIEYGYLEGEDGPVVETQNGFRVDGLEIRCRHDFAAKVIDFRGLYLNSGA